jgi:nitroimidazol reductase NimA-like FMN-containing flavoprotein (pyridoxamine 5'-phosphate oxidase superfamily)
MLTRLSEEEAKKLLTRERVGRLGCITNDGPYIIPISYYFTGDCIYSHSLPDLKIDALRKDPPGVSTGGRDRERTLLEECPRIWQL